jgi:hypothetical protein
MDVQIVTSSLTQIQGGLSASSDEIACFRASLIGGAWTRWLFGSPAS